MINAWLLFVAGLGLGALLIWLAHQEVGQSKPKRPQQVCGSSRKNCKLNSTVCGLAWKRN